MKNFQIRLISVLITLDAVLYSFPDLISDLGEVSIFGTELTTELFSLILCVYTFYFIARLYTKLELKKELLAWAVSMTYAISFLTAHQYLRLNDADIVITWASSTILGVVGVITCIVICILWERLIKTF